MVRTTKRFTMFALVFVVVLTMMFPLTAFAAESGDMSSSVGRSSAVTRSMRYNVNGNWTTVFTKPALTCTNVRIWMNNYSYHRNDVRMLNSQGQVVWSGNGAILNNGQRTFLVDTGVVKVQVRLYGAGAQYSATAVVN